MGLFKRSFDTKDEDGHTEKDLFSHSNSLEDILADEARRKREALEKAGRKRERKLAKPTNKTDKNDLKAVKGEPEVTSESESAKRRRITTAEGLKLLSEVGLSAAVPLEIGDEDEDPEKFSADLAVRESPRRDRIAPTGAASGGSSRPTSQPNATYTEPTGADDYDDEVMIVGQNTVSSPTEDVREEEEEEYDSDPDIARIQRAAREKRKQQQLAASAGESTKAGAQAADSASPAPVNEPSIKYLIDSPLEGTKPLLVYRKLSQRLQELREAWIARQDLPQWQKDQIFFVNQLRKLYDSTTGIDLGLKVDGSGNIVKIGSEHIEGANQVHLQAVTEDLFTQLKKQRFKAERGHLMLSSQDEEEQVVQQAPKEQEYKIILKAKNLPEQRFKVRLSTMISKLEWVARDKFSVGQGATIWLEFDGERLDPNGSIADSEIATCDDGETITIDVYIK